MTAACRHCGKPLEHELIDLGHQPLANSYLEPEQQAIADEQTYPLRVMICDGCWLVQVDESVPADAVFHHDYAYYSSYSSSWVAHAERYCRTMVERFDLGPDSKVIEVASNDGYLLQHMVAMGVPSLGIEPAGKCAEVARAKGIETHVEYFNAETATQLIREGHTADLTAANNVLAHVPNINGFAAGFPIILKPEGVSTFEFPHLLNMIDQCQFDTIYHEHYSYLSLTFVERLFTQHGMRVFDVETLPTHGGSIRVFLCHKSAKHQETKAVSATRRSEREACLDDLIGFRDFAERARTMRDDLRNFLDEANADGKTVAAYGAAAKGNTFLNFCGVNDKDIAFAVDLNPQKQDKLLPGSHIPVSSPDRLTDKKPDYILILPWNLADEISAQHAYIKEWGGRFVVAAPQLKVLEA